MNPLLNVELALEGRVRLLRMNRPEKRNALNVALVDALSDALSEAEADAACRIVVLLGNGPIFCAGLDLVEAGDSAMAERSADGLTNLLVAIGRLRLIVIAAARGAALGGGAGLLAAADLALGASDLRIAFPETRRGLVPAIIAPPLLARLTMQSAKRLFLLGGQISAEEALKLGLVDRVFPADSLEPEALRMAETVLLGAPNATSATKRLLLETQGVPADVGRALAHDAHLAARQSAEVREGLDAFREKRPPRW